jgi:signal transduction histidine kinase
MNSAGDLLIPLWLRTVRIGLLVTGLVLVGLCVFLALPGHGVIETGPYLAVLASAGAGAGTVAALPWRRLFERGVGIRFLYAWSAGDIVLISVAIAVTGGGRSELFLLYALTTVFFNASYPVREQAALLALTFACYLGALAVTGLEVAPGVLFLRLMLLGLLALLAGFLSLELTHQMRSHAQSAAAVKRWASLLSAVAAASREMTLERDRVVDVVLGSVRNLGFDGAALAVVSEDGTRYRIMDASGMPEDVVGDAHPVSVGVAGRVLQSGRTAAIEDPAQVPGAIPGAREAGFRAVCATPVWVEGWMVGVLLGAALEQREVFRQEVEALELLAVQAGLALENAGRFEEQRHTVERLQELDRMKSDFVATVSHELRTPVTVIRGVGVTLERAWNEIDDVTREDMLSGLNVHAASLDDLIGKLLDFSKLEMGPPDVRVEDVDLGQLVSECVNRHKPLLGLRPLEVGTEPELVVRADPSLLERVMESLISNAGQHTDEGTRVRISASRTGAYAMVAVADQGPGIPQEAVNRLGERFFRGGELNYRPKGLGLGLALAREVLELHGSELEIESAVARGSTFSFRLPLRNALEILTRKVQAAGPGTRTPPEESPAHDGAAQ